MKFSRRITRHAKARLFERYGLTKLPKGRPLYVKRTSTRYGKLVITRRVYQINDVHFVLSNSGRIMTFLTKEMVDNIVEVEDD